MSRLTDARGKDEAHGRSCVTIRDVSFWYPPSGIRSLGRVKARLQGHTDARLNPAVDSISLAIPHGATFALVGKNGAGKSTLLRIIAGILRPQTGYVHVRGEIATLVGLNMAFRRELTGRENVVLSALARGQHPQDIKARLELIKEFSEIGEAFEQPIRTYSSGMVSRIAFSAATSFPADVLLVDEALAAGDQKFKEKAERRMQDFISNSGSVVMVSHSGRAIRRLCDSGALLERGKLTMVGAIDDVMNEYESQ